jgi:hypothetical protein
MENKNQINEAALRQIIKEEAIRFKKKLALQAEKKKLMESLSILEGEELMEDLMDELGASPMAQADAGTSAPAEGEVQLKPQVEKAIDMNAEKIVSQLSPDQIAQAQAELQKAGFLNASEEEIKNKIENQLTESLNEEMLNEAWDKKKIYNWLIGSGLGVVAAGIISAAIGGLASEHASNLADYTNAVVNPGAQVIASLIAAGIGAISTVIGIKGHEKLANDSKTPMTPEKAAKIIAARKARGRK